MVKRASRQRCVRGGVTIRRMSASASTAILGGPSWSGPRLARCIIPSLGEKRIAVRDGDRVVFCEHGSATVELSGAERRKWNRHAGTFDLIPASYDAGTMHFTGVGLRVVSIMFAQHRWSGADLQFGLTDPHVADLCQRLIRQAELGQPFGSPYVEALTMTLSTYLEGLLGRRSAAGDARAPRLSVADRNRIENFVRQHLDREVSVKELAEMTGYSLDHFARLFKATFGLPPHRYLLECRVSAASEYLVDGTLSLAEIAVRCGFATQAHFTGIFKLRTGLAPGEFRRRLSQEQAGQDGPS
jgi:AraC family transcriptional regulator